MLSVVIFVFAIFAILSFLKTCLENVKSSCIERNGIYMTDFGKGKTTKLDAQISNHGTRISQDGKRFFYLDDTDNSLNYVELSFGWKTGVVDKKCQELHDKPIRKYSLLHKGNTSKGIYTKVI